MFVVQQKIKKLKKDLSQWSKETYEDIFVKIATLEDIIRVEENQIEVNPMEKNKAELTKAEEAVRKYYHIEEYWKQKSRIQWFKEGDTNIKFFHSYIYGKSTRLIILEIKTE